jgi:small nuclear ribonucleoprotein (snRNP)-like protein
MDKRLSLKLNGGRNVQGILRGFDPFMNVVVDEALEVCKDGRKNEIGMVVSWSLDLFKFRCWILIFEKLFTGC